MIAVFQLDAAFEIREIGDLILYNHRPDLEMEGVILLQFAKEQRIDVNMEAVLLMPVRIYNRNK